MNSDNIIDLATRQSINAEALAKVVGVGATARPVTLAECSVRLAGAAL